MSRNTPPVLLWYRRDLRLDDHAALNAAHASGQPILPIFILDDETPGEWLPGGASRWWLHHSLQALDSALQERGGHLILRRGNAIDEIPRLIKETGAAGVYCSRHYEPFERNLETQLATKLASQGAFLHSYPGYLLFDPCQIKSKAKTPFNIFTPFYRACLQAQSPAKPVRAPNDLTFSSAVSEQIDDWGLIPQSPNWASGFSRGWQPGEKGAKKRITEFLARSVSNYAHCRDRPGVMGTSRLSPHLHFGEISPATVWHAGLSDGPGESAFLREIGWREFAQHLLFHRPTLPRAPLREEFSDFPWIDNSRLRRAWENGQTGIPLVDAGMRELWSTGWMHNRIRMITASALVKYMMVPWVLGERWFWDTLVDANLASNAAGWQWVAGCGTDAAPYFRIFNPVIQGQKFDDQGDYIRRWCPELQHLPDRWIHAPWTAPTLVLAEAGIRLGAHYPKPLVEPKAGRVQALSAWKQFRQSAS